MTNRWRDTIRGALPPRSAVWVATVVGSAVTLRWAPELAGCAALAPAFGALSLPRSQAVPLTIATAAAQVAALGGLALAIRAGGPSAGPEAVHELLVATAVGVTAIGLSLWFAGLAERADPSVGAPGDFARGERARSRPAAALARVPPLTDVDLLRHGADAIGLGVGQILADGGLAGTDMTLARAVARWGSSRAWWTAVRATGVLPTPTTCARCLRPEWRYTRLVELTEPRGGPRRVFELVAAGHLATCDLHGAAGDRPGAGEVGGSTVLVATDVTARVDREVLLAAGRDTAIASARAARARLLDALHSLSGPLTALQAEADGLRAAAGGAHPAPSAVADRIEAVSAQALAAARDLEAGTAVTDVPAPVLASGLDERSFGVAALIHDLEPLARQLVAVDGNRLQVRCGEALGTMVSDALLVRQVLLSLVCTASRGTRGLRFGAPPHGARRGAGGEISLSAWRERQQVVFVVADGGCGLTDGELEQIRTDHWASDPVWCRDALGLSLARRLARLLGGELSLRSRLGEGSTTMVTFPVDGTWTTTVGAEVPRR